MAQVRFTSWLRELVPDEAIEVEGGGKAVAVLKLLEMCFVPVRFGPRRPQAIRQLLIGGQGPGPRIPHLYRPVPTRRRERDNHLDRLAWIR